ncbi:hypothetical protein [Rhodocyclus tenuis]|nr:hypothetical protein [Rhodocyclus tenuis]
MILDFFASRSAHPLDDPAELRRVIAALPPDNPFKAVDEVFGWLESLQQADDVRVDRRFEAVRALDDAAQPHLRRLARDYLQSSRLSKNDERRLWSANHAYWEAAGSLYARCLRIAAADARSSGAEAFRNSATLASARLVAARGMQAKWFQFRYAAVPAAVWRELGGTYLAAEAAGVAQKPVQLYPQEPATTTVSALYLQSLALYSSSADSLSPLEIELADRLLGRFLAGFDFSPTPRADSVYWVDAGNGGAPMRLARDPQALMPTLRFFSGGASAPTIEALISQVERGDLPADLKLGAQFPPRVLLPVLQHLALYWAPKPPMREHPRHAVRTRVAVLNGFDNGFSIFAGELARLGRENEAESWVIENVSLGGFGAVVDAARGEWLKVGALLALQPAGGDNWLLGVVGRCARDASERPLVGIRTLARYPLSVQLRPRASGLAAINGIPGIWLREGGNEDEARFLLPPATFNLRETLEFFSNGGRWLLSPVELEESGEDFELARYRLRYDA